MLLTVVTHSPVMVVLAIVLASAHVHVVEGVQVTVSVTPVPLLHDTLPEVPEKLPVYVVVVVGETEVEPDGPTAPGVGLTVPDVAPVLVQDNVEL